MLFCLTEREACPDTTDHVPVVPELAAHYDAGTDENPSPGAASEDSLDPRTFSDVITAEIPVLVKTETRCQCVR